MESRHTQAEPALLTIGEAARALGVSVDTVRRWADSGRLRVLVLPSGHRRFYAEDVSALLEGCVMTDFGQLSLDVDPRTLAHSQGPITALMAAQANQIGKESNRYAVLAAFAKSGPCSTAELNDRGVPGIDLTELRRRTTDLLNLGLLERLESMDGRARPGHLWRVTGAGRRVLAGEAAS